MRSAVYAAAIGGVAAAATSASAQGCQGPRERRGTGGGGSEECICPELPTAAYFILYALYFICPGLPTGGRRTAAGRTRHEPT